MDGAARIEAVAANRRRNGTRKQGRSAGAAKLSQEADKVLTQKSKEIAESLGEASAKGSVLSAKLLLELAQDSDVAQEDPPPSTVSTADELAAEPQWEGASPEENHAVEDAFPQN